MCYLYDLFTVLKCMNSQSFDWLILVHLLISLSNINLEYLHWDTANSFNAQTFMICEIKLKGCDT